jgi:hypothetical protein
MTVSLVCSPSTASHVMATHGRPSVEKFFRAFYFVVRACFFADVEAL